MHTTLFSLATLVGLVSIARANPPADEDPPLHVDPSVEDCEVHFSPELTQPAYARFVREFGSASAFKQMGTPEVVHRRGISVAIEYMRFRVDEHADAWNDTFTHPDPMHYLGSDKDIPKLKLRVGIGGHTDLGAYYSMNPMSNFGWIGIDAKHAFLRQGPDMPLTLSVRGAYTKTLFIDDMDMHAVSADVSVGRTFRYRITPYLGAGTDAVLARETSSVVDLDTEYQVAPHAFAGLEVAVRHLTIGAEAHYATIPSAHAQVGWVF